MTVEQRDHLHPTLQAADRRFAIPAYSIQPEGRTPGLESCVYNMVTGLLRRGATVDVTAASRTRLADGFVSRLEAAPKGSLKERQYPGPVVRSRFVEETFFALESRAADQVVYPNYFVPPTELGRGVVVSTIIHDCLHHVFPQYFSRTKRLWLTHHFRRALQRCDAVYLISEWERSMIARYYGEALATRSTVIFNSIDWSRFDATTAPEMPEWSGRPFILSVCNPYPHKRVPLLIEAFGQFGQRDADTLLALSGRPSGAVAEAIAALPDPVQKRIKFLGRLSDTQLGQFYRSASVYVTASRYEGFGMPVVEALGHGLPTIITESAALPEVTLGLATQLPREASAGEFADAMLAAMARGGRVAESDAARVRRKFSVDAQAARLLELSGSYDD